MTRQELIERLEKAEGPSYALDLDIAQALVPQIVVLRQRADDSGADPHTYRAFSAKVDDALWLAETLLPGAEYQITNLYGVARAALPLNGECLSYGDRKDGNVPLAICIATLKALEATEATTA